jgi:D-3-phosphoglycerate dehydrogenase
MNRILILARIADGVVEDLRADNEVRVHAEVATDIPQSTLDWAEVIILRRPFSLTRALQDKMPRLHTVFLPAERSKKLIDFVAAEERGLTLVKIQLPPTPVAEITIALLLAIARHVPALDRSLREGKWLQHRAVGIEIRHKVAAVIGFGRIGRHVGTIMKGLGAQVVAVDRTPGRPEKAAAAAELGAHFADLDEAVRTSDILLLCAGRADDYTPILDRARLALLKPGTLLVNAAHASLVDPKEVLAALNDGRLSGYGIDVFDEEPPIGDPLLDHPLVVATPHIGSQTRDRMDLIGRVVLKHLASQTPGAVTR